jgi:hypothetical protein
MDDRTFASLSRRAFVASTLDASESMTRTPPAPFPAAPTRVLPLGRASSPLPARI